MSNIRIFFKNWNTLHILEESMMENVEAKRLCAIVCVGGFGRFHTSTTTYIVCCLLIYHTLLFLPMLLTITVSHLML